jgi:hypothetical protein
LNILVKHKLFKLLNYFFEFLEKYCIIIKWLLLSENLERSVRRVNFVAVNPVTVANESVEVEGPVTSLQVFAVIRRADRVVVSLQSESRVALNPLVVSRQQGSPRALPE